MATSRYYNMKFYILVGKAVKAGTQERGTERGAEVRCKVRLDERSCAHCEGAHGYSRDRQVYLLAV